MADAVFIGTGHNALACAAILADRGWSVEMLERAETPGGAVRTHEATLPGFRHDMGAMNLSLFAGSPFHARFADRLARHGLAFAPAQDCFATAFPDGRWFGVSIDPALTAARAEAGAPGDGARWRALLDGFAADAPHIFSVLGTPMAPGPLMRTAARIWRARGTAHLAGMMRLLLQSPNGFLDETFEGERLRTALAAWGMHLDFPPDQGGGALFPYLEAMANQSFGLVIGKGGAEVVTRALVGMIEEKGGVIRTGAEVTGITHAGGRASGVRLADGTEITADRAVIAGVAPSALPRLTGGSTGDARYDRGVATFSHAPGTMMVHLALDGLPDWAAGAELKRFAYVHLAPTRSAMAMAYAEARAGMLPREPVLVVGQPTVLDPSRAPAGKHILWVQVRMVPGAIQGDAAGQIAARDWPSAKAPMTERVLDILESYAPGLQAKMLGQAVQTPAELEAENPNLVGGDQICGSHHPWQNFIFRPVRGYADWRTPVRDLYLIGAGTWPGAGVGAGSGTMLADRLPR